ncbi:ATP-grasp fold amidoligase family protein [Sphingopyxis sp. 113P3]|uniref:ATP-grasp fold amidoligase family protein n=1 Tax=Sphingopyxis sp. (strain 113P3) TaxID=292913 RepID=UPI0006BC3B99|nr:ATP-grasp fold amidoligase family protein [Sphingopyxis sp. 113P3]ALC13961.1 hypothetical protein LH20_18545 [Sphingopyxis sp. 113P3]
MSAGASAVDRLRAHILYAARHRRRLNLASPRRFTEWVQWRKLFDHDPRQPRLQDKVAVKFHVAELLGPDWITPTLWHGTVLPDRPLWQPPFVLKARHGCNQNRYVRDVSADWSEIRRAATRWMRHGYGGWLGEWLYREIPRGLLVEPFVGEDRRLPIDYKIYVFGGYPAAVQVHRNRETGHSWALFTPDWRRLAAPDGLPDPAPPRSLARMIAAAALLGEGFDFIRVDFYEVAGAPRFGEISFYPGSGLDPFRPDAIDLWLGELWRAAREGRGAGASAAGDWLDRAARRADPLDQP